MATKTSARKLARIKRKARVRARIHGTAERPRLSVYRSNKHFYAQVIDDRAGKTLAFASTLVQGEERPEGGLAGKAGAAFVGELVAKRALEKGIQQVVFDRNGFIYRKNGVIAMLADGARKAGLKF